MAFSLAVHTPWLLNAPCVNSSWEHQAAGGRAGDGAARSDHEGTCESGAGRPEANTGVWGRGGGGGRLVNQLPIQNASLLIGEVHSLLEALQSVSLPAADEGG